VLIDVFVTDPEFGERSREALSACIAEGRVVACDVVWAEVTAAFDDAAKARAALERLGASFMAGEPLVAYRRAAGRRRGRSRTS
jgi:predicted nucleic acid-binding protein